MGSMSSRAVAALLALVLPLGLGVTAPHVAQAGPVTPDVVNGRTPEPGEFGFLAAVKVSSGGSGYYSCGGSFVSTTQVVTAAHCFYDDKGKRLTSASAAPGDGTTWPSSFVSASKIEVHAQYSPSAESYDIALITLSKPIAGVATALIPTESQWRVLAAAGSSVSSAGWGTTSSGGSSPDDFRVADLTVIPDSVCGRASGTYQVGSVSYSGIGSGFIASQMLCAGGATAAGKPLDHPRRLYAPGNLPALAGRTRRQCERCERPGSADGPSGNRRRHDDSDVDLDCTC